MKGYQINELGKLPPQAVDIESQILSDILFDSQILPDVEAILVPEAFYLEKNKEIYSCILALHKSNAPINQLTVTNKLKKQNSCSIVDGIGYIIELVEKGKLNYTVTYDCLIVHQEYIKRVSIEKASKIAEKSFEPQVEIDEIIHSIDDLNLTFDKLLNCSIQNIIAESEINPNENIKYEPHFLAFKNGSNLIGVLSKNSMSVVMGKAKSRKTFATTCLASYIIGGLNDGYVWAKKSTINHYDTEQSRYFSQKIIKRIQYLTNNNCENYKLYAIKRYDVNERKKIIETTIKLNRPDMIIIDGVRDLMYDFNDLKETTQLINWLMMLMDKYNIHIQVIVHVNKADTNARGHLGSELMNKCETAIIVEKSTEYKNASIIKPCETRGESFKPLILSIENGNPYITGICDIVENTQTRF